jgi:diguanylate cyclase (GGDEF)-like protein
MRDLMGGLGSRLREAPAQLYRLLGALFVLAVILDVIVARTAGTSGHRWSLFFTLVVEDAVVVAAIYAYVASVLLEPRAESYVSPAGHSGNGEDLDRLNQVLDSVRTQLDAAVTDNDELRGQLLGEKGIVESLRARLNVVCEHTDNALINLDRDCNVLGITASASELLRTTSGAAVGRPLKSIARLYDIDRDPKRERPIEQLSQLTSESGSGSKRLRGMVVFGNEDELMLSMTAIPAPDAYGVAHGAVILIEAPAAAAQRQNEEPRPLQQLNGAGTQRDPLTHLPNSAAFDVRIAEMIELARRYRVSHALMLLSVDELDVVNREFGSTASEEVLRQTGELMQTRIAAIGDAYRVSLYTFAALIPELSGEPARELAEALRNDLAGNVIRRGDRQFNVTASLALIEINESTEGPDVLMETANNVLLEAAVAGGNRVVVYHPDEKHLQTRRDDRSWIDWLMPRFERNLVHLVSQTIMPSGKEEETLPWVEVFVRVEEDDGHWLPPGSYLPALRRNRLTPKLDLWVLEQCLGAVAKDHAMFKKHAGLTINLDSATVVSDEFRRSAAEMFERLGGGDKICFEIEEGCANNNSAKTNELITALKPFGVNFLLDQCRSGAAIPLLRRVPFDFVKFHESMVRRMMSDPVDRSELEWINQAAHLLGRKTVASHVESKEVRDVVTRIGVDYVQGLAIDQLGPLLI